MRVARGTSHRMTLRCSFTVPAPDSSANGRATAGRAHVACPDRRAGFPSRPMSVLRARTDGCRRRCTPVESRSHHPEGCLLPCVTSEPIIAVGSTPAWNSVAPRLRTAMSSRPRSGEKSWPSAASQDGTGRSFPLSAVDRQHRVCSQPRRHLSGSIQFP